MHKFTGKILRVYLDVHSFISGTITTAAVQYTLSENMLFSIYYCPLSCVELRNVLVLLRAIYTRNKLPHLLYTFRI